MSTLVIVCEECGARFRLEKALLKDSKAVRIRCRRCGGYIVVRVPEETPAPVQPTQEAIPPPVVVAAASAQEPLWPWPVTDGSPTEPRALKSDISCVFTSEPVTPPPDEKAVPPDHVRNEPEPEPSTPLVATDPTPSAPHAAPAGEPEPAWPGTDTGQQEVQDPGDTDPVPPEKISTRLEDLFAFPPGKDAGPDRIPLPPEEYPAGVDPADRTTATEPERKAPSRREPSILALLIVSGLWILLLAAGALYFGTTKPGQEQLGRLFGY